MPVTRDVRSYLRQPAFAITHWAWHRGWIEPDFEWYCWHRTRPIGRPFAQLANRAGDWPHRDTLEAAARALVRACAPLGTGRYAASIVAARKRVEAILDD